MTDRTAEDVAQDRRIEALEREVEILKDNAIGYEHALVQLAPLVKLATVADHLHKLGLK